MVMRTVAADRLIERARRHRADHGGAREAPARLAEIGDIHTARHHIHAGTADGVQSDGRPAPTLTGLRQPVRRRPQVHASSCTG